MATFTNSSNTVTVEAYDSNNTIQPWPSYTVPYYQQPYYYPVYIQTPAPAVRPDCGRCNTCGRKGDDHKHKDDE